MGGFAIKLVSMMLGVAQSRRPPLPEIVLWIAASRSPSESQTSECSDLLSRSRATFVIVAQRQPGKLHDKVCPPQGSAVFSTHVGSRVSASVLGPRLRTQPQGTVAILAQGTHRGDALCAALFFGINFREKSRHVLEIRPHDSAVPYPVVLFSELLAA